MYKAVDITIECHLLFMGYVDYFACVCMCISYTTCPSLYGMLPSSPVPVCMYTAHIKCLDSILAKCTGAAQTGTLNMVWRLELMPRCAMFTRVPSVHFQFLKERFKIDVPHRFKPHSFLGPNFCDMCGQMMHGIFRQGLKCEGTEPLSLCMPHPLQPLTTPTFSLPLPHPKQCVVPAVTIGVPRTCLHCVG